MESLHRLFVSLGIDALGYPRGQGMARFLVARRRLSRLLEQLQEPLSAYPRPLPRGQPSAWDTGALSWGVKKWAGSNISHPKVADVNARLPIPTGLFRTPIFFPLSPTELA